MRMRRFLRSDFSAAILLCLVMVVALAIGAASVSAPVAPAAQPDPLSYTVKLVRPDGHGSAVHIGGGVYLTAAHVVAGVTSIGAQFDTGVALRATVLVADHDYDIAILMAEGHTPRASAPLSCSDPATHSAVRLIGNPLSVEFLTLRGYIAGAPRRLEPWTLVSPVDSTVTGGMSGGPVLDDAGNVVGITVGVMGFGMGLVGIGAVVPGSAICRVLSTI